MVAHRARQAVAAGVVVVPRVPHVTIRVQAPADKEIAAVMELTPTRVVTLPVAVAAEQAVQVVHQALTLVVMAVRAY